MASTGDNQCSSSNGSDVSYQGRTHEIKLNISRSPSPPLSISSDCTENWSAVIVEWFAVKDNHDRYGGLPTKKVKEQSKMTSNPRRLKKKVLQQEIIKEIHLRCGIIKSEKQISNKVAHITAQFIEAMICYRQGLHEDI
ncbi:hypothetical protein BGZ65_010805, partial [Modicella reniformis]